MRIVEMKNRTLNSAKKISANALQRHMTNESGSERKIYWNKMKEREISGDKIQTKAIRTSFTN